MYGAFSSEISVYTVMSVRFGPTLSILMYNCRATEPAVLQMMSRHGRLGVPLPTKDALRCSTLLRTLSQVRAGANISKALKRKWFMEEVHSVSGEGWRW